MKGTLTGILISALIHAGLFTWLLTVWASPLPKPASPEVVALSLAMFKESPAPAIQPAPKTAPKMIEPEQARVAEARPEIKKILHKVKSEVMPAPHKPKPVAKIKPKKKTLKPARMHKPKPKPKPKPKKVKKVKKPRKTSLRADTKNQQRQPRPVVSHKSVQPHRVQQKHHPVHRPSPGAVAQHSQQQPVRQPARSSGAPVAKSKPAGHRPQPIPSQQTGRAEANYKARLQGMIESMKHYPRRAKRRGKQGRVLVTFTLLPNGVIKNIRLAKSSGNSVLDAAAMAAVRKVSGKLPFPHEITRSQWVLSVPIVYSLR